MDKHSDTLRDTAADYLWHRRQPILAAYRCRFDAAGHDLVGDTGLTDRYVAHADSIIRQVCVDLRDAPPDPLAVVPPPLPEGAELHPRECFRAVSALADLVLADLDSRSDPAPLIALVAGALTRVVLTRLLDASTRHASALMNQVREAQVGERSVIARELHDRLGHSLSAAYRNLEAHELAIERRHEEVDRRVVTARQALHDAVGYLRALTTDLQLAQPLGSLDTALANFLSTVDAGETRVDVVINGDESWVPPPALDEVFLVVREAMRNALAHAGATSIRAVVDIAPHELRATVVDDGVGFDTARVRGVGLRAMAERAAALGGRLALGSAGTGGTSVELVAPLMVSEGATR
ncbi:sensor histidine kinase [Phytohabitans sp. LJ34]|uniref:sensor histidine kinase n=1 Tax=Phytohabitans sp. LJ34 TaxID=3452217 RepID=UPI003F8B958D